MRENRPVQRAASVLLVFATGASIALGVARAGSGQASGPLLGITGNVSRFENQTGQKSTVDQAFLGWGQGLTYGSKFSVLFQTLGPIPMIHLGTKGQNKREAITPGGIAAGQGDGYLVALNHGDRRLGQGDLHPADGRDEQRGHRLRPATTANGTPKDAAHSPASYRKAFARIYLILHGGTASAVNAKLRQLGLPPLQGGDLPVEPVPAAARRLEPARERQSSRAGQRRRAVLPRHSLRRRRGRRHLRRAPHRHRAVAGPRDAVSLRALAPQAVLRARVGTVLDRRPDVRAAHVHVPEDTSRHRERGISTRAGLARSSTSSRSR